MASRTPTADGALEPVADARPHAADVETAERCAAGDAEAISTNQDPSGDRRDRWHCESECQLAQRCKEERRPDTAA